MEPKFMISEVFGTSWKYTKSQIWVLVGLFIGYFILSSIISLFGMPAQGSMVGKIIVNLISAVISSAFMLGYIKNLFQTMDGEEPQFSAYGQQSRKIFTYLIASIIRDRSGYRNILTDCSGYLSGYPPAILFCLYRRGRLRNYRITAKKLGLD